MSDEQTTRRPSKAAFAIALLAASLAAAWWLARSDEVPPSAVAMPDPAVLDRPETVEEAEEADAKAREAALAQIAAESSGTAAELNIEAAPNFIPAAPTSTSSTPVSPEGYSFAAFHGEMAKARMEQTTDVEGSANLAPTLPAWLQDGNHIDALVAQAAAAGRDWTFGWVALSADAGRAAAAEQIQALGGELIGESGRLLRARLPGAAENLVQIANLAAVAGIAATPSTIKIPSSLTERARALPFDQTPVYITLMADDPDGRWREALADVGTVVGRYDSTLRTLDANIPHERLGAVAAADFVLAVEPIPRVRPSHDTSVPSLGADALRVYDESSSLFTGIGGSSVPIGVMDTGLNINHEDIVTGRRSICGANLVPGLTARNEDRDLWIDDGNHGTHVTGTIAGNGTGRPRYAGVAPLVQHIRFAKVIGVENATSALHIGRGMEFLAEPTRCGSATAPSAKALLVNMSLGLAGLDYEGRTVSERQLDAVVWGSKQLYVVSAGNGRDQSRGDYASAKNSLTVGAALDNGDIAAFSSLGPTFDGRLLPHIVSTGVDLVSAAGQGYRRGYTISSGTSMSSPSVAGVAALLMDAQPQFKEQPAAVRARLMASAVKPDAFLDDVRMFPLHNGAGPGPLQNQYGLGLVSARTSVLSMDEENGWVNGAAIVEVGDAEYGYQDIEVPEGASRLDIVMTWDEPPSDTFAEPVLNDLDLWVDRGVDCPEDQAVCGDAASRSNKDNVEWLILRNPLPGTYRLKVVPKRTLSQQPRAALAWTIIRGPSTPQLAVAVESPTIEAEPGEPFRVEATVTADGYVAAGTTLRLACRGGASACQQVELLAPRASAVHREDNISRPLNRESSEAISLGEVAVGEEQKVTLAFKRLPLAERFRLYLIAEAWNASSASTSVEVIAGDSDVASSPLAAAPANDAFANATRWRGQAGSTDFDLLLATPEPAEPVFTKGDINEYRRAQQAVRPRSIWYAWTPPASDNYRISIARAALGGIADDVQIDLFAVNGNDALVSLRSRSAKIGGGMTFGASRGQAYRIRLSYVAESQFEYDEDQIASTPPQLINPLGRRTVLPLSLHWGPASLPANDDFALAAEISGERGSAAGSNLGGTLQPGEFLQDLSATTWYRWTAPADGDWQFRVDRRHSRVAVFTGSDVADLRLLSGEPDVAATLLAREGVEYRVLVAAKDAASSGSDYTLTWAPGPRPASGNDDIARAAPIPGLPSSSHFAIADFATATVERGEPLQTGSRTVWWAWQAPVTGTYTWRVETLDPFRLTVFRGDIDDLALLAMNNSTGTGVRLSFPAVAGERHWLALGLPGEAALVPVQFQFLTFYWGPTPGNDNFASATTLAGANGTVSGSNAFATTEGNEIASDGDASLWWTWQAPADGWYRFSLADNEYTGRLVVYENAANIDQLRRLARSRRLSDTADVVFRAQAGVRYTIRLGRAERGSPGEFELSWGESGPPTWNRYVGAALDGGVDGGGAILEIAGANSIAMNANGSELYVATDFGLQTYQRDAASGDLRYLQTFAGVDDDAALLWDAASNSLLAAACGNWQRFAPAATGSGLEPAGSLTGDGICPGSAVFVDPSGSFIYFVRSEQWSIDAITLDAERTSAQLAATTPIVGVRTATISNSGAYVYVAAQDLLLDDVLHVFARDADNGTLELMATLDDEGFVGAQVPEDSAEAGAIEEPGSAGFDNVSALAMDAEDKFLFVFSRDGTEPLAFDLADAAAPTFLANRFAFTVSNRWWEVNRCAFADVRTETISVDVFCTDSVYSVRLLPEVPALRAEDDLSNGGTDVFGNIVPRYVLTGNVAKSPDGRYFYATAADAIVIFERVGSL